MASNSPSKSPMLQPTLSSWTRLLYSLRLRFTKGAVHILMGLTRIPGLTNTSVLPSYTKAYPCRPKLVNRVFIPKTYKNGDAPLPLYLDIHGGGFVLFDARADDRFCSHFANDNKVVVVSIEYSLAPASPFPAPIHEVVDIIKAVLEDDSLPIDKSKVAVGGFSAGGNLSLAVSQTESLRGKIGGVVAVYPVSDFTRKTEDQLATRPKDAPGDGLVSSIPIFNFAYIPQTQDLKDPLLSVAFAARENLPNKICLIGCEWDLLCKDAELMAERLAGTGERKGSDVAWEKNGIKWEKILGRPHGFDMVPAVWKDKAVNIERAKQMYDSIAEWLFREVYV